MSYFTHLECSVPCGPPALDPRTRHHLCAVRRSPARPLRPRCRASWSRDSLRGREPNMWRYRELMPLFDGEIAGHARRRVHAAVSRAGARRDARPRSPLHQGRIAQPDQLVQGARPVGGDHARQVSRRDDDRAADRGQRRQRRGGVRGGRGSRLRGLHPEGRQAAVRRRVPPLRRQRDAGRWPDHRRRPPWRRKPAGRSAGTTSRRSRSRTASKARRRWPTSSPSRWTGAGPTGLSIRPAAAPAWSGCGRRSTRSSGSAGCRRASGRGWCRCRPRTARRSSARSSRAPRRRSRGKARRRSPTACACRARSATS